MRIKVTSEQHLFIPDGSIIEVSDAYGKNLLDRNVGKLLETLPIETATRGETETAALKRAKRKDFSHA